MSPKSITLHRATADNAGGFADAGTELTIADGEKAGTINAERARDLLSSHGATGHYPPAADKKKPARKKAATKVAPKGSESGPKPIDPSVDEPAGNAGSAQQA